MKVTESKVPFNYKTIKITQSRINKGLLAIPVSLVGCFPRSKTKIYIAFGESLKASPKNFTPYESSSRECRIGGMKNFYELFQIKDGDELVIQILDDKKYRISTEKQFENSIKKSEKEFDKSRDENEAGRKLTQLSKITNVDSKEAIFSEFFRLSRNIIDKRQHTKQREITKKETVPASIRKILAEVYMGKCQITGFGFLMKNGKSYFEIHHIKSDFGNHLKNLLVVSPNVHAQFTYANIEEHFDKEGWLRRVKFNKEEYNVNHITDKIPKRFEKEVHY
ncbi:MAG: HNH endonuclease [Candidatus Scalinduaceae bacterium]